MRRRRGTDSSEPGQRFHGRGRRASCLTTAEGTRTWITSSQQWLPRPPWGRWYAPGQPCRGLPAHRGGRRTGDRRRWRLLGQRARSRGCGSAPVPRRSLPRGSGMRSERTLRRSTSEPHPQPERGLGSGSRWWRRRRGSSGRWGGGRSFARCGGLGRLTLLRQCPPPDGGHREQEREDGDAADSDLPFAAQPGAGHSTPCRGEGSRLTMSTGSTGSA